MLGQPVAAAHVISVWIMPFGMKSGQKIRNNYDCFLEEDNYLYFLNSLLKSKLKNATICLLKILVDGMKVY